MARTAGERVFDPRPERRSRSGVILEVVRNPACQRRSLVIQWAGGETEEVDEELFGPLED